MDFDFDFDFDGDFDLDLDLDLDFDFDIDLVEVVVSVLSPAPANNLVGLDSDLSALIFENGRKLEDNLDLLVLVDFDVVTVWFVEKGSQLKDSVPNPRYLFDAERPVSKELKD